MARFVFRRFLSMLLVMFAVSIVTFLIFNVIPNGDPAERMAGKIPTETNIAAIREEWGFNESVFVQYGTMMKKVFTGDLESYFTQLNVGEEMRRGLPATLSLAIGAAIMWLSISIVFGLYSAMRAGKTADRLLTGLALVGVSLPVFWVGDVAHISAHLCGAPGEQLVATCFERVDRAGVDDQAPPSLGQ